MDLQRLQNLYPGVYAQGSMYTLESGPGGFEYGQKCPHEGLEVVANSLYLFPSGGKLPPIQAHERGK